MVGPQRHQVGDRGAVRGRSADDGDPRRVRPPLRPHRERAAARGGGPRGRRRRGGPRAHAAGGTALGVGTEADIRDYFRLAAGQVKPAIAKLVADGELERVEVDGWTAPAYLRAGQIVPRRDRGTALLCPFDPLIFFRPRVERLFEFHYRIEIYTPARQAPVRLLRVAVPARRQARRAGRPEGRTGPRRAARRRRVRRTGRAAGLAGGRAPVRLPRRTRGELRGVTRARGHYSIDGRRGWVVGASHGGWRRARARPATLATLRTFASGPVDPRESASRLISMPRWPRRRQRY